MHGARRAVARRSGARDRGADQPEDARRHARHAEDAADAGAAEGPDAEDGQRRAVPGSGEEGRHARRDPDPEVLAGDGGRFITLPMVFTKDPETGMRNIGTYRMQVFDGRTTGMHWQRHKGGAQHYRVAERLGEAAAGRGRARRRSRAAFRRPRRCPRGSTSCCSPDSCAASASSSSSACTVDLEVPASAQIVLEGYVEPGERRREGPFGDHTGFYSHPGRLPGLPRHLRHAAQEPDLPDDRRRHPADGGLLPRQGERADLPAAHQEDGARDRRHELSGRGHLPQHRDHLDRQALSRATRARS